MTLDMQPVFAADDLMHGRRVNTVLASQSALIGFARCVARSDSPHLVFSELGNAVGIPAGRSALCLGVPVVYEMGAQEQVVRPDASFHVAMVTDQQPIGYCAKVEFPRYAVGVKHAALMAAAANCSVSTREFARSPQPAIAALVDFLPETVRQRSTHLLCPIRRVPR